MKERLQISGQNSWSCWLRRKPMHDLRLSEWLKQKLMQSEVIRFDSPLWPVLLLLCVMSVTGCATNSPPPVCNCPTLPALPSVSTPQPSTPYLDSVLIDLKDWRERLKATPLTR